MSRRLAVLAALLALLALAPVAPARADDRCRVPLADWQPREALIAKLEQAGWKVVRLRADDGCYKVMAIDRDGRPVKARFDPATLDRVEGGGRSERGRRDHDDEHD